MPPKTLHLTNSWHETSGGIATFYRALIEEANRQEREIRLVVPAAHDSIEPAGKFGKIYHVQAPHALLNSAYRMIYPPQFLRAEGRVQQILRQERPGLVEICDKYTLNYLGTLLSKRLLRNVDFRPVIVGLSCERMDDNFRTYLGSFPLSQKFCSLYMKWLYYPFFDHHIANSEYTATELRAVAQGQSAPRATWIRHMGVDLSHLSPRRRSRAMRQRLLQNFGASEESVLLLYVGRLAPEKNLSLLFQLIRHLAHTSPRDFRLLVVGDGIERHRWESAGPEHRVLFLGHIKDRSVLADIYANADFFVHPNPREPFGIAPLEAMASGLPLIAPNAGGVTSYANPGNAWTVPATVESFAATVEEALTKMPLTLQKLEKALATAQAYRWETVAASFLDLYEQLHRASTGDLATLPPPNFNSTLATGWQAALIRGAARTSETVFAASSRLIASSPKPARSCAPRGETDHALHAACGKHAQRPQHPRCRRVSGSRLHNSLFHSSDFENQAARRQRSFLSHADDLFDRPHAVAGLRNLAACQRSRGSERRLGGLGGPGHSDEGNIQKFLSSAGAPARERPQTENRELQTTNCRTRPPTASLAIPLKNEECAPSRDPSASLP